MPNPTSITVLDADLVRQTISTLDALLAVFGTLADAPTANGSAGTLLGNSRAVKDAATDTITQAPVKVLAYTANSKYKPIAASSTSVGIGPTGGAIGDYLNHIVIVPATTSPGAVSITDGALLSVPVLNTPTTSTTGGTLAAATYFYKVTALGASGETLGSNEVSQVTTGTTSTVSLSWAAIPNAVGYHVYRGTSAGAENVFYAPGNVTSFTDTNASSTSGSVPSSNTAVTGALIPLFTGGANSVTSLVPFSVPVMASSTSGPWRATIGPNVSIVGVGSLG